MSSITLRNIQIQDPPLTRTIFSDARTAWVWAILRIWLGYNWIDAALHKIGVPAWTETGAALKGFWSAAVVIPTEGRPPITFSWYRSFIQFLLDAEAYTWFGKLVAYGELLVGIALVIGAFTGFAAFFAGFMNWNFMMAGTASSNPLLFIIALGLIMAWKVSGLVGADFFLLRWVGTPWKIKELKD
jgi:thiosulfate dehydrogenase [quinone] large subunit